MLALLAFPLTVESIMQGPALVGQAPRDLRWSADGTILRFRWAKPVGSGEPDLKPYQVRSDGTGLGPATPEKPEDRRVSLDQGVGGRLLYSQAGDLYVRDDQRTEARRAPVQNADSPVFSQDGKALIYLRGGAAYRTELSDGTTVQLSHVVATPATVAGTAPNLAEAALTADQSRLLKYFSPAGSRGPGRGGRSVGGGADRQGEAKEETDRGVAIVLPAGRRAGGSTVSSTGRFATVEVVEDAAPARIAEVPSYVTQSGYTEMLPTYPKVGAPTARETLLIADLSGGKTVAYVPPRSGTLGTARWSPDGKTLAFWANAEDHKDAWLVAFDANSGTLRTVWTEHDDAWIGGPSRGYLAWTPEGRLAFATENKGYANLWTMRADGSDARALVGGDFEVSDITLDRERDRFVFVSSEGSPFKRHVDAVGFAGDPPIKLAELSADEDAAYAIAPDGTLAVVRSSPARPAELWVAGKQITQTPTEEWLSYPWIEAPIVMVPARDGAKIPAKLYRPKRWKKGGPAVIFVHGAGYLQNVYEGWSHYFRETMFNQLLMNKGYAVLDMDFRASAGYGKAWRTAIYRNMGGKDLDDNVDGARWLVKELGVHPKRIGLYGGSYGGFITLMAMFKEGDVFAAGAALRPVTDWSHYNHGYTSNILNNPQDDREAYRRSSPIEYAAGLKGALLICHGMVDTNVHFQDSVRLSERLIEMGKKNWTLAPYPVENHAFTRPESWTDEYTRIHDLFDRTIGSGWKK